MPLRHKAEGAGWQVSGHFPSSAIKAEALKGFNKHAAKHAVGAVVLSDSDINHHCLCM